MPVVFTLSQIPANTRYIAHDFMSTGAIIKLITGVAVPSSTCLDVVDEIASRLDSGDDTAIISCDPDVYFQNLWNRPNIYFIPFASRNASSIWHFGVAIFKDMSITGKSVSFTDYWRRAIDSRMVSLQDGVLCYGRTDLHMFFHQEYRARVMDIITIRHRLADQNSRDAYMRMVYCDPMASFDYFINTVLTKTQYFDYLQFRGDDVIINCGVDNGWELPFLLAATGNTVRAYNIDPTADRNLSAYARRFVEPAGACFSFHKQAVWDKDTQLSFEGYTVRELDASTDDATERVEAITIDSFCRAQSLSRVDVIKMDLEGAEPKAIDGMVETVKRFRPQLAVAVYHSLDQKIDIPLRIINLVSDYNFYFDTYNLDTGESIFYAIPREKDRWVNNCFVVE